MGFFLESQRDRFGWKINPGTRHCHMICQRADMCQQAREEETERRNERKEGREESRGGIQIEKKKIHYSVYHLATSLASHVGEGRTGGTAASRRY